METPVHQQLELSLEAKARLLTVDEIFHLQEVSWVKLIDEDFRVERKPCGIHAKTLADWFSMWANTSPDGGIIAIGVEDNGDISGILSADVKHLNDIERAGDIFCPDAHYELTRVNATNFRGTEDQILLIRVRYNEKKVVRTTSGSVFVRRGESKKELKDEEIRELQIEKGEIAWEQEPSIHDYPGDFDAKSMQRFAKSVIAKLGLEHAKTIGEILEHRRLGRFKNGKFVPNKACALLFANDPCLEIPGCRLRFLRFDGKDEGVGEKYNAIKDEWIEGTIPAQLVAAERVIGNQLREYSRLGKDSKFSTSPEYPKPAWYEAVVNAMCHRSYNLKNTPVFVKMFDDRLEVESPGGFLPFVNATNIYDSHQPRNPDLMNALYFMDYVKCAHEGTRRMRETMQELQLPDPVFVESKTSHINFKVILKNNVEHRKMWIDSDAVNVVGELVSRTLTEHERRIINYVAEFQKISVTDSVRITGKAWESCKAILQGLETKGILRHVHRKKVLRDSKAHFVLASQPQK